MLGLVLIGFGAMAAARLWLLSDKVTPLAEDYTNSFGIKFKHIRPGTFTMGDRDQPEINPPHQVTLTRDFYMGVYEVTNAQFRQFRPDHDSGSHNGLTLNQPDQPVVNVSWEDAAAFCKWLSDKENRTYRLPTEAEWEYCCRAGREGDAGKYPWGRTWPPTGKAGNYADAVFQRAFGRKEDSSVEMEDSITGYDDGYAVTAPVGSFTPNPWGLYDMGGNAEEWCDDWYDWQFCQASATDPRQRGPSGLRVVRDQSWCSHHEVWTESSYRHNKAPDFHGFPGGYNVLGFRVILLPYKE